MRILLPVAGLLVAFGLLLAPCAPGPAYAQDAAAVAKEKAWEVFTEMERTIEEFYKKLPGQAPTGTQEAKQGKAKKEKSKKGKEGLPPGLAKKDELPPGLQKHLEKHGTLPPGLQKRALPAELEARLPKLRRGLDRVVVDRDVVLVDTVTGKVLDILRDVIKGSPTP